MLDRSVLDRYGEDNGTAIPIRPLRKNELETWAKGQSQSTRRWIEQTGFTAGDGEVVLLPGRGGTIKRVLLGLGDGSESWAYSTTLPDGLYRFEGLRGKKAATAAALAWGLGGYSFTRYKSKVDTKKAVLVWPAAADRAAVERDLTAICLVRDLINTPAEDMGPAELATAAQDLSKTYNGSVEITEGPDLEDGYPSVHAVGKGSPRAPRMIDIQWGDAKAPKVTLVGKGVCFDSGGLGLKPDGAMLLMKKDMGGAAHVLGLAKMIMEQALPVRLRVLIPAVENSISGSAFRPMDILKTRKGISVEVGHTDAEGRLVLADALTAASEDNPALIIDMATLTGAARSALGPDIPPFFTDDEALSTDLEKASLSENDPLWRLPLWAPYRKMLESKTADINNVGGSPFAGAITAALFLKEFVTADTSWVHLDVYGWNKTSRSGRPEGGEAFGIRALFSVLERRYGKK